MQKGFTLIEIMTAVTIFAIVMTISMGAILGVFDTNRKSEALKAVMDNLNLAVESMSREIRFGTNYICNPTLPIIEPMPNPTNCSTSPGGDAIGFKANDGRIIVYQLSGDTIEKSTDGGGNFLPVTAEEIRISELSFYVLGATPGDDLQPKVLIKMKGTAGVKDIDETDFTVQTLVSQRQLDL
jgi:prepilin-type N-terminal cleavage/methylation domain-containing protein